MGYSDGNATIENFLLILLIVLNNYVGKGKRNSQLHANNQISLTLPSQTHAIRFSLFTVSQ